MIRSVTSLFVLWCLVACGPAAAEERSTASSDFTLVSYSSSLCTSPQRGVNGWFGQCFQWFSVYAVVLDLSAGNATVQTFANANCSTPKTSPWTVEYGVCDIKNNLGLFRGPFVKPAYHIKVWPTSENCQSAKPRYEADVGEGQCVTFGGLGVTFTTYGGTRNVGVWTSYNNPDCSGAVRNTGTINFATCSNFDEVGKVFLQLDYAVPLPEAWPRPVSWVLALYRSPDCSGGSANSWNVAMDYCCAPYNNSESILLSRIPFRRAVLMQVWPGDWMQSCTARDHLFFDTPYSTCVQIPSSGASLWVFPRY